MPPEIAQTNENASRQCIIPETLAGQRLDKALAGLLEDVTRTQLQHWIDEGHVQLDELPCTSPTRKVKAGECYHIQPPAPKASCLTPWAQPLDILFEDAHLLVINKPAGMVVHPAAGHSEETLVHALLAHCGDSLSGVGGVQRPGIVHRLDKDTSGLMLVAKHDTAHQSLATQLANRSLSREYQAIIWGTPSPPVGCVDAPIARHATQRQKMAVRKNGKAARTHYTVLQPLADGVVSYIACKLETGRTHQIRVHMTHQHHPLVGDPVYGNRRRAPASIAPALREALHHFPRQALHAGAIAFLHPESGETMRFTCALPTDMQTLLSQLSTHHH